MPSPALQLRVSEYNKPNTNDRNGLCSQITATRIIHQNRPVMRHSDFCVNQDTYNSPAKNLMFNIPTFFLALLSTACVSLSTPNGNYSGSINPTGISNSCEAVRAFLNIQNGRILFVPNDATWTLEGTAALDGKLQAERTGRSANKQPYSTRFTGTWAKESVSGTYTTPKCTYAVDLARHR